MLYPSGAAEASHNAAEPAKYSSACPMRVQPPPEPPIAQTPPVGGDLTPRRRGTLAPFRVGARQLFLVVVRLTVSVQAGSGPGGGCR